MSHLGSLVIGHLPDEKTINGANQFCYNCNDLFSSDSMSHLSMVDIKEMIQYKSSYFRVKLKRINFGL